MTGCILFLLFFVASGALALQRSPASNVAPLVQADDISIAIRVTHIDGQAVAAGAPPTIERSVTLEGVVTNLPRGAAVRLFSRTAPRTSPAGWHALPPRARIEQQHRWTGHVDVSCRPDESPSCEILVIVSPDEFDDREYDEAALRSRAFAMAGPVRVRLPPVAAVHGAVLAIERVNGAAASGNQPVRTSSVFTIEGTSRQLAGKTVSVAATCGGDRSWEVLGQVEVAAGGAWAAAMLTLPAPVAAADRTCRLVAATTQTPPAPGPVGAADLFGRHAVRSPLISLVQDPYQVAFLSLTGENGEVLNLPRADPLPSPVKLAGYIHTIEVATDPLPADVRVWQLLRCEECSGWLAFGPAQKRDAARYVLAPAPTSYPRRPLTRRFRSVLIAARENLEGRALTEEEIDRVALGSSSVLMLDHARPAANATATIAVLKDAAAQAFTPVRDRTLDVSCHARVRSPRLFPYVGYLSPRSGRWFFYRAVQTGATCRVTAHLAELDIVKDGGSHSMILPVIAEGLPVGRPLDQDWLTEMVIAAGDPVRFAIPSPSVFARIRNAVSPTITAVGNAANGASREVTMASMGLWTLMLIVVAAVAAYALFNVPRVRVIVNAWLDARRSRHGHPVSHRFVDVLRAEGEARVAAVRRAANQRTARLRRRLGVIDQQLGEFYRPEFQRLTRDTGRYDVLTSLSPWAHRILLALLTIGESAFNLAVFYVFREPAIYTLLMALAVAISIPMCAFSVGLWIRRWHSPWYGAALKLSVTLALLGAALVGLNHVRMAHLATVAPQFVAAHPELNDAFLSFNALIFLASAMATYWGHDRSERFAETRRAMEQLTTDAARLRCALAQAEDTLTQNVVRLEARYRSLEALYFAVFERHGGTATMKRTLIGAVCVAVVLGLGACTAASARPHRAADTTAVIVVLIDTSRSTPDPAREYGAAWRSIIEAAKGGDRLIVGIAAGKVARDESSALRHLIDRELPRYNGLIQNPLTYREELATIQRQLTKHVEDAFTQPRADRSDLIRSIRHAGRLLARAEQPRKVLVVLSDLLEDSRYIFSRMTITPAVTDRIVAQLEDASELPNLRDVIVFTVVPGTVPSRKADEVARFWTTLLRYCGAWMPDENYAVAGRFRW